MSWTTAGPRLARTTAYLGTLRSSALPRVLPHLLVIILVALGVSIAHESGHALAATAFGARVVMFNVFGMQWFPALEWMPELGFGGYVYWWAVPDRNIHWFIVMAGSNFTLLLALLSALWLNLFAPRGLARTALIVMSFYVLDSLVKIVAALRLLALGWNFRFARSFSEGYYAAQGLGISSEIYIGSVVLVTLMIAVLVYRASRKSSARTGRDTIQTRARKQ